MYDLASANSKHRYAHLHYMEVDFICDNMQGKSKHYLIINDNVNYLMIVKGTAI